jgi:hypothetical protein
MVEGRVLDDDGAVMLKFDNGAKGVLMASQVAAGEENGIRIRVYGEHGGVEWYQHEPNTLLVKWLDKPTQIYRAGGNNGDFNGTSTGNQRQAGNGAGAGGNGGSFSGGFGGIGTSTTIVTGSTTYYGGGGGGGYFQNTGIRGDYEPTNAPGVGGGWTNLGPNSGSGGGSGYPWAGGGAGAAGAVFIRYRVKPA